MEKYWPLISGFGLAAFIAAVLLFFYWWLFAGPRRIRRAVAARLGPAAIQRSIRTSFVYWLVMGLIDLVVAVILGIVLWKYLGWWLYEEAFQGTWLGWLAFKLNAALWVITATFEGIDYAFKLPFGTLLAVFFGIFFGTWLGTKLGRRMAAKGFLLTSSMS